MTTEEKAEAYDEAKLRIRHAFNSNRCTIGFMNEIFSEFKKNEDENIRGAIIDHLKDHNLIEWATWLEKQGEKNPVEPIEEFNGDNYGIDGLWHAITILEKTLGTVKGYQSDGGILEHKCAITAVRDLAKEKREQKPIKWSEEDTKRYISCLQRLGTGNPSQPETKNSKWFKEHCYKHYNLKKLTE